MTARDAIMDMLKRVSFKPQRLLAYSAGALLSIGAHAGVIVQKPTPHGSQSPEMARTLARAGTYTLAGTEQSTTTIPGEVIVAEPSQYQGAVYLFNGTNATPERAYQFPGLDHTMEHAGWAVAMSNQWLAFTATPYNKASVPEEEKDTNQAYIYIVGKTNGAWVNCPTLNSVANNCNTSYRNNGSSESKPIVRIPFGDRTSVTDTLNSRRFSMAISDKYLVLADSDRSIVHFYRYDSASKNWLLEFENDIEGDDFKYFGKAVAISGEKIAVTSTWAKDQSSTPGIYNGTVRIYHRDAATGTWSMTSQVDGHFGTNNVASGNFGYKLAMNDTNLVVAGGTTTHLLAFYRINSAERLTGEYYLEPVAQPINHLSLSGDTLAVSGGDPDLTTTIYSRNTASSTLEWKKTAGLKGEFYANRNAVGLSYPGDDQIALVGDDLSLGWRAYSNDPTKPLLGAVLHEKVSLLDSCREPANLIANCSFDDVNNTTFSGNASGANWTLLNHQGAWSTASYTGRQLRVSIYNPGYDMWHVQARTPVNLSQAVDYVLTFRAKADSNRSFVVNIGHNGNQDNNWQSYGRVDVNATTEWTEYSYEFRGLPMDANSLLDFNLGNAGTSAVTIDSVKLKALN